MALFTHGQFAGALAARWIGLAVAVAQHLVLHSASVSLLGIDPQHPGRATIALWNACEHKPARQPVSP